MTTTTELTPLLKRLKLGAVLTPPCRRGSLSHAGSSSTTHPSCRSF